MFLGEDELLLQIVVAGLNSFVELSAHAQVLPQLPLGLLQLLS